MKNTNAFSFLLTLTRVFSKWHCVNMAGEDCSTTTTQIDTKLLGNFKYIHKHKNDEYFCQQLFLEFRGGNCKWGVGMHRIKNS